MSDDPTETDDFQFDEDAIRAVLERFRAICRANNDASVLGSALGTMIAEFFLACPANMRRKIFTAWMKAVGRAAGVDVDHITH